MIDVEVPIGLIWLLRWLLFLGPLTALIVLSVQKRDDYRVLVGTLFAFLYGVGTIFITHLAFMEQYFCLLNPWCLLARVGFSGRYSYF